MKKLLISLLMLCLMASLIAAAPSGTGTPAPSPTAAAKTEKVIDLSKYEDDVLVKLLAQVQEEIVSRNIERTAELQPGTYVFGQDIPAGKYVLQKEQEDASGMVMLAAADDKEGDFPSKLYDFISKEPYETFITGEEGDVLTVEFSCGLTISAGVKFQ